jgi:hypothetical protein
MLREELPNTRLKGSDATPRAVETIDAIFDEIAIGSLMILNKRLRKFHYFIGTPHEMHATMNDANAGQIFSALCIGKFEPRLFLS